jgi:hypothetical protein
MRLGLKRLIVTNTLAYHTKEYITAGKCFIMKTTQTNSVINYKDLGVANAR